MRPKFDLMAYARGIRNEVADQWNGRIRFMQAYVDLSNNQLSLERRQREADRKQLERDGRERVKELERRYNGFMKNTSGMGLLITVMAPFLSPDLNIATAQLLNMLTDREEFQVVSRWGLNRDILNSLKVLGDDLNKIQSATLQGSVVGYGIELEEHPRQSNPTNWRVCINNSGNGGRIEEDDKTSIFLEEHEKNMLGRPLPGREGCVYGVEDIIELRTARAITAMRARTVLRIDGLPQNIGPLVDATRIGCRREAQVVAQGNNSEGTNLASIQEMRNCGRNQHGPNAVVIRAKGQDLVLTDAQRALLATTESASANRFVIPTGNNFSMNIPSDRIELPPVPTVDVPIPETMIL